jgi:DNA-binding CsgD family transcriptional regulator/GAF domain-containing protein
LSSSSADRAAHPSGSPPDPAELSRVLTELQQLERELIERRYVRRADGLERVGDAVRRLGEIGSPAGVIARAAEELGRGLSFERVLVSRIENGHLLPLAAWGPDDGLPAGPMELGYPLVEDEVAQRHDAVLVRVAESGRRALPDLVEAMGWEAYVVAAIALEGKTVGLLHAERSTGPPLDDLDVELAALYADGLGLAFERAVLREKLQRQRRQLGSAARWINGQSLRLSNGETPRGADAATGDHTELAEVLTPRELEVLRLIARGLSNRAIASALVLGEGTVKYHVKNILRKLQARSRTEAVSRYMRLYGGSEGR